MRLTVQSRDAPALARLLIQGVDVYFVRRLIAWTKGGTAIIRGPDVAISKGTLTETDNSQEGFAIAYFELTLGEAGKQQSWGVADLFEMVVGWLALLALFETADD